MTLQEAIELSKKRRQEAPGIHAGQLVRHKQTDVVGIVFCSFYDVCSYTIGVGVDNDWEWWPLSAIEIIFDV